MRTPLFNNNFCLDQQLSWSHAHFFSYNHTLLLLQSYTCFLSHDHMRFLSCDHMHTSSLAIIHVLLLSQSWECFHSCSHLTTPLTPYSLCLDSNAIRNWVGTLRIQVPGRCKEHCIYPSILGSYRLKLQCLYHHTQSTLRTHHTSHTLHLTPTSMHLSIHCPCWFTGESIQLLWKRLLQIPACALYI
jgi:hypothetical protein